MKEGQENLRYQGYMRTEATDTTKYAWENCAAACSILQDPNHPRSTPALCRTWGRHAGRRSVVQCCPLVSYCLMWSIACWQMPVIEASGPCTSIYGGEGGVGRRGVTFVHTCHGSGSVSSSAHASLCSTVVSTACWSARKTTQVAVGLMRPAVAEVVHQSVQPVLRPHLDPQLITQAPHHLQPRQIVGPPPPHKYFHLGGPDRLLPLAERLRKRERRPPADEAAPELGTMAVF